MNEITKTRMKVTVILSSMTASLVVLGLLVNMMNTIGGRFTP